MKNYKSISLHLNTVCIEPFNINVFTSMMHNTVRIIMTLNLEDFAYGHGKLRITSFGIFTNKHGYAEKLLMQKRQAFKSLCLYITPLNPPSKAGNPTITIQSFFCLSTNFMYHKFYAKWKFYVNSISKAYFQLHQKFICRWLNIYSK